MHWVCLDNINQLARDILLQIWTCYRTANCWSPQDSLSGRKQKELVQARYSPWAGRCVPVLSLQTEAGLNVFRWFLYLMKLLSFQPTRRKNYWCLCSLLLWATKRVVSHLFDLVGGGGTLCRSAVTVLVAAAKLNVQACLTTSASIPLNICGMWKLERGFAFLLLNSVSVILSSKRSVIVYTERSLGEASSLAKWTHPPPKKKKKNPKHTNVKTKVRSVFDQVRSTLQNFCYLTFLFVERYHLWCTVSYRSHLWHLYRVIVYLSAMESTLCLQQFLPLPVFPVRGQLSWLNISPPKLTWLQIKESIFVTVLFTLKYLTYCIRNKHSVHLSFYFIC